MARSAECLAAIDAAAQGKLSDEELEGLIEDLDGIRQARDAGEKLDNLEQQLFDRAEQIAEDVNLAAQIEKRNRLRNIIVRQQIERMADEAFEKYGDASLALEAVLVGINKPLASGRLSADARGKALLASWFGGLHADLRKAGLDQAFARGDLSREISRELWDLSLKAPTGTATKSKEAKQIAAIIHKYRRAAIERENRAGAYIRYRQGYVTRQSHNRVRMEKAGFDAWFAEVNGRLDWDQMGVAIQDRAKFARSAYNALVTGVRKDIAGGDENDLMFAFKGPGNLAKKESASRVLLFKSADDWFDYNETFGAVGFNESIIGDLGRSARNTGLMEALGTNPRAMVETMQKRLQEKYRDIDTKQAERLSRKSLNWFMDEIDGTADIPRNMTLASWSAGIRAIQTMAKLGGAFLSAVSDLALVASERRYQGRSLMGAWGDVVTGVLEGVAPGKRRDLADLIGVGLEGQLGNYASRFVTQDDTPRRFNKVMNLFFRYNLLGPWSDANKRGLGLVMARDLANKAKQPWDGLDENTRRIFEGYGLTADKWEYARQAVKKADDGREYLMPGELPEPADRKGRKLRDEVQAALSTYITDRVDVGVLTPGARERAFMKLGLQRGTPEGEALRFVMQFKSFSVAYMTKVLGREVHGRPGRSAGHIAEIVATTTALGFVAMQAKEIAKGREPRDPEDPATLIAAMMQGGGLGIYGDFLLGEANRFGNGPLETIAGPTLGAASDAVQILQRARGDVLGGEAPDAAAEALRFVKGNTPFLNMFYTKTALDYLVWFQLQESINPGYLRRMERRMKRENNQEFFVPPSRAIPRGGGDRIFEGVR